MIWNHKLIILGDFNIPQYKNFCEGDPQDRKYLLLSSFLQYLKIYHVILKNVAELFYNAPHMLFERFAPKYNNFALDPYYISMFAKLNSKIKMILQTSRKL